MKILLAPSETKISGGDTPFTLDSLLFNDLLPYRKELLHTYMQVLEEGDMKKLSIMFGLKKESDILRHKHSLLLAPTMKAIERYTGVAFNYLAYPTLSEEAQNYLHENLLIFSNIFGVVKSSDKIPEYRLQQGKPIENIKPEQFYKPLLQERLDYYLQEEEVLDLRAGFYEKYYKPSIPYTTLKFLKNGKVVSHWAKAYRGIVLREIAKAGASSIEAFMKLPIEGLSIHEIQTKKNKTEIIYSIES